VFSPYYAWTRRRGPVDPLQHSALNVALYGKGKRWTMTERGASAVDRGPGFLSIGPSALSWDGTGLTVQIEEIGMPLPVPRRVRGTVRLYPSAVETRGLLLDSAGRHHWQPIAPCARVEVALDEPGLSWSGPAYFDTNAGDRPLEDDFIRWDWSRAPMPGGTAVLYDLERRDGPMSLALRYTDAGGVEDFVPPLAGVARDRVAGSPPDRPCRSIGRRNAGGHAVLCTLGCFRTTAGRAGNGNA
jgi:carotenoid 1,2-hydratase